MKQTFLNYLFCAFIALAASSSAIADDTTGKLFLIPTKINNQPNDITSLESSPILVASKNNIAEVASSLGGSFGNDQIDQDSDSVTEDPVEDNVNENNSGNNEEETLDCAQTPEHPDCVVEDNNGNTEEETLDCTKTPEHPDCNKNDEESNSGTCELAQRTCDTSYDNDPDSFCFKYSGDARCSKDNSSSYDCSGADKGSAVCLDDADYLSYCQKNPKDPYCTSETYCQKMPKDPKCSTSIK